MKEDRLRGGIGITYRVSLGNSLVREWATRERIRRDPTLKTVPLPSGLLQKTNPKAALGQEAELAIPLNGRLLIGSKLSFSRPGNLIVERRPALAAGRDLPSL